MSFDRVEARRIIDIWLSQRLADLGVDLAKDDSDKSEAVMIQGKTIKRVRYNANLDEMATVGWEELSPCRFDGSPHDLLGPPKPAKPRIPLKVPAKRHTYVQHVWPMRRAVDAMHAPRTIRHVLEPEAE